MFRRYPFDECAPSEYASGDANDFVGRHRIARAIAWLVEDFELPDSPDESLADAHGSVRPLLRCVEPHTIADL